MDAYFLVRSLCKRIKLREWTDGNTYPYCPLDVSSASHPFYTGKQKLVDTGSGIDRFRKRFGNKSKVGTAVEEAPAETEAPADTEAKEETASE